jgi:hypothetical protein
MGTFDGNPCFLGATKKSETPSKKLEARNPKQIRITGIANKKDFENLVIWIYDGLVKSRLTGENRCPVFS